MSRERTLTCKEMAEILNVTDRTVRRMIERGDLTARKYRGQWSITFKDFTYFINKNNLSIGLLYKWAEKNQRHKNSNKN